MRHDRAGLAKCAKIFPGIEAEAAGVAHCACFSTLVLGAVSLSGILNDKEPVRAREFQNRIHVRRLPKKMNRNDRFRSVGDRLLQLGRVHRVSAFVNIDKHRPSCTVGNRFRGGHECVGHSYYFVPGPDAARQER